MKEVVKAGAEADCWATTSRIEHQSVRTIEEVEREMAAKTGPRVVPNHCTGTYADGRRAPVCYCVPAAVNFAVI
jgi:hypothetical protein